MDKEKTMAKIITILNNKGGVGKTTTTFCVGTALQRLGKRVLLIDLDSQGNLSSCFNLGEIENHVGDFMLKECNFTDVVQTDKGLDIIPSNANLQNAEERIHTKTMREKLLKKALVGVADKYDFVLMDCPPNMGIITTNALFAADYYIAPIEAGTFAYQGIGQVITKINELVEDEANVKLLGVVVIKYHENMRDSIKKIIVESLKENLGDNIFRTYIRTNSELDKAQLKRESIFDYAPNSNAAEDYLALTNEILTKL